MKNIFRTAMVVLMMGGLSACAYKPPKESEPHAVLKVRYVHEYKSLDLGDRLEARAFIQEGDGARKELVSIPVNNLQSDVPIQSVLVRPGAGSKFSVWMGVVYPIVTYETVCDKNGCYTVPQTEYHDSGCDKSAKLSPENGKTYLLDFYSPKRSGCSLKVFEQVPTGGGQFSLKPINQ